MNRINNKHKLLDFIQIMSKGQLHTVKELADYCDVSGGFVRATLKQLEERGMVRFVGFGEREAGVISGTAPSTWRWV